MPEPENAVDCVEEISPAQFHARYYAANRPVLWKRFWRDCRAVAQWSPRHLAGRFGEVAVEVMMALERYPNYEVERHRHSRSMRIRELVDAIEREPYGGDLYLVAQSHALQQPEFAALLDDLQLDPAFFDAEHSDAIRLWLGPGNTVTPLHYDLQNVLLAQVYGRKRIHLIRPADTGRLYNHRGGYSGVDPEKPDLTRFPLFEKVAVHTVVLEAGDALFLPIGWWHHVRSLSPSISLGISNFVWGKKPASVP